MARLTHTVTVTPLDRRWFEEAADTLVDLLDSSRVGPGGSVLLADGRTVDGLRLVEGRHLRTGARYGQAPPETGKPERPRGVEGPAEPEASSTVESVVLRAWRPGRSVEVESRVADDDLALRVKVRLSEPRSPRALDLSVSGHRPEGGSLYRVSGRGTADLAAWWAAVDRPSSAPPAARPPLSARAVHRLARARLTVTPRPADDGSWRISVVLGVRGRWLLRPVGAVALFFARRPMERGFREAVERAAGEWNRALAELTPRHGEALRAEIADALTETAGPEGR
ncbi:hypothetical protein [Streptomyces sp. NPDC017448]|uniref:hypothetical protein n=1 Tax=Streptomyces sp. NPDC017448 TaxID=3364996 RepID=UPI003798AF6D